MKKSLCLFLVLVSVCSLCACSGSRGNATSVEPTPTVESQVRNAVEIRGRFEYAGYSFGGKEVKSSQASITNVKRISDTEYRVSGRMVMIDIYGTRYTNTFDCTVSRKSDYWSAGSFKYTSNSWTKG